MSAEHPTPMAVTDAIDAYVERVKAAEYPGGSDAHRAAVLAFAAIGDAIEAHVVAREAALKAEVERLTDAVATLMAEAAEVDDLRPMLAVARANAATCRQIASEAIACLDSGTAYARKLVATLRARLASPEPARLRAMVETHAVAVLRHSDTRRIGGDLAAARAALQLAEADLLAALGAKED